MKILTSVLIVISCMTVGCVADPTVTAEVTAEGSIADLPACKNLDETEIMELSLIRQDSDDALRVALEKSVDAGNLLGGTNEETFIMDSAIMDLTGEVAPDGACQVLPGTYLYVTLECTYSANQFREPVMECRFVVYDGAIWLEYTYWADKPAMCGYRIKRTFCRRGPGGSSCDTEDSWLPDSDGNICR